MKLVNNGSYTWHHTEVPGKMQLVPFCIHNITTHNGGRSTGMWADAFLKDVLLVVIVIIT
ncbi:HNH endonuclease [Paenibacillus sp. NPDC056933]|uniref:HNH endonuclease signature motif containing protein n=1 Tax=Paenibacillus sp. NPDC056933 TaxID=3345968 RepID=UPI003635C8C8